MIKVATNKDKPHKIYCKATPFTRLQAGLIIGLALLSLMSSNAEAQVPTKMCSSGFDHPAFLVQTSGGYELHIGNGIEKFQYAGSVGTGLNGTVLLNIKDEAEVIYIAEINMDANIVPNDLFFLLIFRDRVFWPCDRK